MRLRREKMRMSKRKSFYVWMAELVIAGELAFAEIAKKFRKKVAEVLTSMGRGDLATDSNAQREDEDERP